MSNTENRVITPLFDADANAQSIAATLNTQRQSFIDDGYPTLKTRIHRLDRLIDLLRVNKQRFSDALRADYRARSQFDSVVFDVMVPLESLKYLRKNTAKWTKKES